MIVTFEANGRKITVDSDAIAYSFPSIVSEGEFFITLKNGRQFRARHVSKHDVEGDHSLCAVMRVQRGW
ncbi:hypothetical protein [Candidatus Symbiopectobacterium endolongispinus]|uniref:hypothetical protein n=1 Tax=Candidatus Symbiopectobacterium endolongispinus TaxID=2812664 RepID=UPI00207A8E2D|nr:hypothetical protein [Candidatus Symbiopectobacterium endolongispinus]MBT9429502.1 hypothetical protein [Candidatus Symbiopectobacterium endolongispinus]